MKIALIATPSEIRLYARCLSSLDDVQWIGFGGFTLQPSEVAKYAFVIFAAAHFAEHADKVRTFRGILPVLAVGLTFCVLIIAEPNMSITMCVGLLMLAMVFLSGTNLKTFALILLPFVLAVPLLTGAEGLPAKKAHATAIALILPLSAVSTLVYALTGGGSYAAEMPATAGVFAGGIVGALLLSKAPAALLTELFYGVMMFAGIKMLFGA